MADDRFDLQRFVDAQDRGGAYDHALAELRAGHKRSHWIWFVFPQIEGLGSSETARFYAISSLQEATAYLAHAILGPRLVECSATLLGLPNHDPVEILGEIDAMKLRSSMTLFTQVQDASPVFGRVLDAFYAGARDQRTELLLTAGTG
jgi:uncharacterized protein (DUF1810 family)